VTLRPYQQHVVDAVRASVASGRWAPLVVMPTGTGKTRTAAAIVRAHAGPALWVAPRIELVGQAREQLDGTGCIVATNQSLLDADVPASSLVIWDEAHHAAGAKWSELRAKLPAAVFVGLTATPERGDGRGLGGIFDDLIVGITVKDAVAQGHLVPAEVLRPDRALGAGELAQHPVDAYLEHARGTQAIVFASTVALAEEYADLYKSRGVAAACVHGDLPSPLRAAALADYSARRVQVLTSVAVLTEGFDAPLTETVILARGFGTPGGYLQAVGRGLRPSPGKTRCLVLDLRGCSHDHGEPDDARIYSLDGKAIRRAEDEQLRFCPVCGMPTTTTACEQCGYEGELRLRKPRVLGLPMQRFARVRQDDTEARAARLRKWLGEARAKGHKPGAAMHRFKAVYGRWPTTDILARARQ
jgi:superfamily II DNA or RNA helicase